MARPTKYKQEYNEQVEKLCRLGATDKELADFFNVTEQTINNWKKTSKQFFESIKKGKILADANVSNSLYHRAIGYSHKDTHISNYQGEITVTEITKYYPPDTPACIYWLNNRSPYWNNKGYMGDPDNEDQDVKFEGWS